MPAALRIILSETEDQTLQELSVAEGVPRRTKLRAIALRLNADGWNVPEIAKHLKQSPHTVRRTMRRWQVGGRAGIMGSIWTWRKTALFVRMTWKPSNNGSILTEAIRVGNCARSWQLIEV